MVKALFARTGSEEIGIRGRRATKGAKWARKLFINQHNLTGDRWAMRVRAITAERRAGMGIHNAKDTEKHFSHMADD